MFKTEIVYTSGAFSVVTSSGQAGRRDLTALSVVAEFPLLELSFQTLLWRKLSAHLNMLVCSAHDWPSRS